jgi:hypothetical protein
LAIKVVEKEVDDLSRSPQGLQLTPKSGSIYSPTEEFDYAGQARRESQKQEHSPQTFSKKSSKNTESSKDVFESYSNYQFQKSTPKIGNSRKLSSKAEASGLKIQTLDNRMIKEFAKQASYDNPKLEISSTSFEELDILNKLTQSPLEITGRYTSNSGNTLRLNNYNNLESSSVRGKTEHAHPMTSLENSKVTMMTGRKINSSSFNERSEDPYISKTVRNRDIITSSGNYRMGQERGSGTPLQSPLLSKSPLNRSLTPSKRIFEPINTNLANEMVRE